MEILEILGWIAIGIVSFFIIGCLFAKLLINILFFDELIKNPIKDFFYGLIIGMLLTLAILLHGIMLSI